MAVVEAAYDLASPVHAWLDRVLRVLHPLLGGGFGGIAYTVRGPHEQRFTDFATVETPPGLEHLSLNAAGHVGASDWPVLYRFTPRVGWATESMRAAFGDDNVLHDFFVHKTVEEFGFDDVPALTVSPANGGPVQFTFPRRRAELTRTERTWMERLAAHLEAGLRLRHAEQRTEAVIRRGRLVHAEGEAVHRDHRNALTEAARRRELTRIRRLDSASAIEHWNALVRGRWTIIDHVDTDGQRLLIARRNDAAPAFESCLTVRERQVALLAARGLPNKHIAYEIGVAESTVSRALGAVLQRLGLRTRYELAAVLRVRD